MDDSKLNPELKQEFDAVAGKPLGRRQFVQLLGAAAAVAAGGGIISTYFRNQKLTPAQSAEVRVVATENLQKLPKHRLGTRMGNMQVAQIVICQDWNPQLYEPGFEAGCNFIHKAGYMPQMPDFLKRVPRESYYTDVTVDSTPNNPDDEEKAYNQVKWSLDRTGFGYFDIFRAHYGWHSVEIMRTQKGTYRAFERLKKEGKVKYFGVSQHNYRPYPEILAAQIEDGVIDSIQLFISYPLSAADREIMDKCHRAGIGMTGMKVNAMGRAAMARDQARQAELKAEGMPGRAALRQALTMPGSDNRPILNCCVTALGNMEQFEENLGAVSPGGRLADGFHHEVFA